MNTVRVILSSDPFCPQCGHNRDKSSVSSVDLGEGRKGCQMCGAEWVEVSDAPSLAELDAAADSIADLCETNKEREQAAELIKALVRRARGVALPDGARK